MIVFVKRTIKPMFYISEIISYTLHWHSPGYLINVVLYLNPRHFVSVFVVVMCYEGVDSVPAKGAPTSAPAFGCGMDKLIINVNKSCGLLMPFSSSNSSPLIHSFI